MKLGDMDGEVVAVATAGCLPRQMLMERWTSDLLLGKLPRRQREAFRLRANGHTHAQVAHYLGIKRQVAARLLDKATRKLMEMAGVHPS